MVAMAELIQTRIHNQYVDILLCRILKQNVMIRKYDWYSDMFMAQAAEVKPTYKYT